MSATPSPPKTLTPPKILIVGAGAVGVVYAAALHSRGEEVWFFVKEKYLPLVQSGITLQKRTTLRKNTIIEVPKNAVANAEDLNFEPDEIWLCISKTAVESSSIEALILRFPDATLISFQPGIDDLKKIRNRFPDHHIEGGVIGFVAFQSHAEEKHDGICVWYPPIAPSQFYSAHAKFYVDRLNQGGCPSRVNKDAPKTIAQLSLILVAFVLYLELSDWGFSSFKNEQKGFAKTVFQSLKIVNQHHKTKSLPGLSILHSPFALRTSLWAISTSAPFSLEAYLKFHFLKVRDQSIAMMSEYKELGIAMKLPHDEIISLLTRLE